MIDVHTVEADLDVANRRIYLTGEINDESCSRIVKMVTALEAHTKARPVDLWLNSRGGNLEDALGLYDFLRASSVTINVTTWGTCMSSALIVLASGHERASYRNTSFMMHDTTIEIEASPAELATVADFTTSQMSNMIRLLGQASNNKTVWPSMIKSKADKYFTASQAHEWGLVTRII